MRFQYSLCGQELSFSAYSLSTAAVLQKVTFDESIFQIHRATFPLKIIRSSKKGREPPIAFMAFYSFSFLCPMAFYGNVSLLFALFIISMKYE